MVIDKAFEEWDVFQGKFLLVCFGIHSGSKKVFGHLKHTCKCLNIIALDNKTKWQLFKKRYCKKANI